METSTLQYILLMQLHERNLRQLPWFADKNTLGRPPVEHTCWPESFGNADWAARSYSKFCCFLRESERPRRGRYYHVKQWPLRGETILGQKNVTHRDLVDKTITYLPPLHIKLWLIEISVKALNKEGEGFDYLRQIFPHISKAKIKEGNFVGSQVKQLL